MVWGRGAMVSPRRHARRCADVLPCLFLPLMIPAHLSERFLAQDAFVHWPPRASCSAPSGGGAVCDATKAVSISVAGAGTAAVNGVYERTGASSNGFHIFAKDSGHTLYRWGGAWRIGLQTHGLFYSEAVTGLAGPPLSGWLTQPNGTAPPPANFTCVF